MPKKILVTGARGFVGSRVLEVLKSRGYDVIGTTDDIRDKEGLRPHFWNVDYVVHAAGQVQTTPIEVDYYSTNILGTANIAELCMENKCKLIHIGSIETKNAYGISKRVSEVLVEKFYVPKGLKAIILRMCVIMQEDTKERKRYKIAWCSVDKLANDIEEIIRTHNFKDFKLIDYKEIYEEPTNIH